MARGFMLLLLIGTCAAYHPLARVPGVCTAPSELICSADCSQILFCISETETIPADDCPAGTFCLDPQEPCGYSTACFDIADYVFECTGPGLFPNPYDCNKFYICPGVGVPAVSNDCPEGIAFNSFSKGCNIPMDPLPPVCEDGPVPQCKEIGQIGALRENPSMFYVCHRQDSVLYPVVYECTDGVDFDETLLRCVPSSLFKRWKFNIIPNKFLQYFDTHNY